MTQSGGQAAGIQLQVGLDLAYFRGQMQKVSNIASSEFTSRLDVRFNKRTLDAELNNLQRAIKRRVYRVEIGGNLSSLPGQIKDLREQLSSLEDTKIDVGVGAVKSLSKKDAQKIKTDLRQSILSEDKKILVPVSIKSSITREDVRNFKNAVKSKLSGLSIDVKANVKGGGFAGSPQGAAGLMEFMQSQGMIGKTASGMKMQMGGGNLEDSLNNLQQQAKKLATDLVAMGNAARTTGQASIQEAGKVLRPQNYGLKINSLVNNVEKLGDGLRRADQETASSLLPQLTGLSSTLRTVTSSFVSVFGANRGLDDTLLRFDAATRQAANAVASYAERIQRRAGGPATSTAGPPLLPGSQGGALAVRSAGLNPYKIITAQVRESFDIIEDYHKRQLNSFIDDYKKIIDQYHRNVLINTARQQVRNVRVSELAQGRPLLGPGSTVAGLLPPAGGTTPRGAMRFNAVSTGAFLGQPQFMRAPNVPSPMAGGGGGGNVPPRPPSGGGGMGGAGSFGRALGGINLPGTGVVREIGDEFAHAAKQVLLYGTTYKALAFFTSFPAQVGQAVGALQSFRNTLNTIAPTAEEVRASNEFILDTVDRYNVPLESARTGFTRLYASMAPAGFKGDEIRELFLGISKTSATLGLGADQVDRVTYAFGQMASKGQFMAEEVTGQLGDVIPGALSIMAEAAGMGIKEFKKAMEDGAFVGTEFTRVMNNVPKVLEKEFGKGAEGAAKTFQGLINRMQNSTKLLYEAFEPVAVGFLNSVVVPLTSGIKTITDGFNAFFTGQAAQTAGGGVFAKQLEALRPAFEGIAANIKQILPLLQSFASTALSLGQVLLQIAGNPFVGYLARIYLSVLPLTMVLRVLNLQALIPLIGSFLRAIPAFISFNAAMMSGAGANRALTVTMQLTGQTAGITAGKIRLVSAALATLGSAAILAGIGLLVERFMMMKGAIDGVRQSTQQMLGSISGMANSGAVRELKNVGKDLQKQRGTFEELRSFVSGGAIAGGEKRLTEAGAKKFEEVGMGSFVKKDVFGKPYIADFLRASEIIEEKLKGLDKQSSKVQEKLPLAAKIAANLAKQAQSAQAIAPIPGGDGTGATGSGAKPAKERESQIPQLMLRLEKTRELAALELQITNATLTNNTAQISSLELAKQLIEFKYEAKELDLQDLTTAEKAIAKREIALRAEQAILASQLQLQIDLRKERDSIQQGFSKILEGYEEESGYQQMYLKLIDQGIRPALAKARVEVEKSFKEQEKQLDASIALNKENIAATEITIEQFKLQKNLSEESEKQLADAERRLEILKEELGLREGIKASVPDAKGKAVEEAEKGLMPKTPGEYIGEGLEAAEDRLKELTNMGYQGVEAANAIGDAFGTAFKGIITGSMTAQEALAGMFQSIADHFADMVAQMIAEWIKMMILKGIEAIINPMAGLGNLGGGALSGATSAASTGLSFDPGGMASFSAPWTFANGGIAAGGFTAFANGGMVTGPTMGLVGEGRYNEAIVPLPDGKSIPVELSGGGSSSPTVIVNVDAKGSQVEGNEQNANQLGRVISAAVQTELIKQQRPGGLLAR